MFCLFIDIYRHYLYLLYIYFFFQNFLMLLHFIYIQTLLSKNSSLSSYHQAINVQYFGDTVLIYRKEACSGIVPSVFLERLDSCSPPMEWCLFLLAINKNVMLFFHILNTDLQCWFGILGHQHVW